MRGSIIVRTEHDCAGLSPEKRTAVVTQKVRSLSDEGLQALARRREKQAPGAPSSPHVDHPACRRAGTSAALPGDQMERLRADRSDSGI
ncbi:hypothetical protein ACJU26_03875 [Acidithiobacillus sp. M4-SHS-6]|uniref:hypothetical protein n=1 Tax=Acidithiobacillus sp. M4-SHS-6 TaxID=3383024 RepID=UPI0039BE67CE